MESLLHFSLAACEGLYDARMAKRAAGDASSKTAAKTSAKQAPETFEAALDELETIVRQMESGEVPLDDSLKLYERGTFLIGHCQGRLDTAEKQIEKLSTGPGGKLKAEPIGEDALP